MSEEKKILVVDDAAFTRNMLKKIINKADYTKVVGEASDGNEAIKLYKQLDPDLVTMDLVMPVKGGIETIEEIKKIDSDALIICVSALGQEALVLEAAKKGAKDFIQKPFKSDQVTEVLERTLLNNKDH
jgi:two-component system chemotaxis response regulator CheY